MMLSDDPYHKIYQNIHTIQVPAVWHFPGVFTSHEPCLSQVCRPPHASLAGGLSLERVNRIAIVMESPPKKGASLHNTNIGPTNEHVNKIEQASSSIIIQGGLPAHQHLKQLAKPWQNCGLCGRVS